MLATAAFPRVEVLPDVRGDTNALGVPATLVDVGARTLTIETACPFPVGAIHELRLTRSGGAAVRIRVWIQHSRRASGPHGALRYTTNMEFVDAVAEDGHTPGFRMIYDLGTALTEIEGRYR
jgi:hypothetical protein